MASAATKKLDCPDCDEGPFMGEQGLGRHRSAKHGVKGSSRNGSRTMTAASNSTRRTSDVVWTSKDKQRRVLVDDDENVWFAEQLQ